MSDAICPECGAQIDQRARNDALPLGDKGQWLRSVEAQLNEDERAFLHRCVAKMGTEQFEQLTRLSIDDAVTELRREIPRPAAEASGLGFLLDDESFLDDPNSLLGE